VLVTPLVFDSKTWAFGDIVNTINKLSNDNYCVICKELVTGRFELVARDARANLDTHAKLCDYCYDNFISSANNEGKTFKAARVRSWLKHWKKDKFRNI